MKSVRLDTNLAARLREAAQAAGVSESTFIREAVAERCSAVLGDRLDRRLADVLGIIHTEGGRAREAHRRFGERMKRASSSRRKKGRSARGS